MSGWKLKKFEGSWECTTSDMLSFTCRYEICPSFDGVVGKLDDT